MKAQKKQPTRTAQPRSIDRELDSERTEEGLSIEPEELGQSFLRYATQQGNFESEDGAGAVLKPDGAAASDAARTGGSFSPDADIWENTVDIVTQEGSVDEVTGLAAPALPDDDDGLEVERGVLEIDLTESVIDEASLLDDESDVLGETLPKHARTDDTGPARQGAQAETEEVDEGAGVRRPKPSSRGR